MPKITQSTMMPYAQKDLFNLINDVKTYPEFMPYCHKTTVLEQSEDHLMASITLQKGPLSETFTTKNELHPYSKMVLHLVDGPFKHLEGAWTFEAKDNGCTLVTLQLDYDFNSRLVAAVFGGLFQKVANQLVENFHQYAHKVLNHD